MRQHEGSLPKPRPRAAGVGSPHRYRAFARGPAAGCACGGSCPKCAEKKRRAPRSGRNGDAELAEAAPAAAPAAAPEVPQYRDCTRGITGVDDANERLETARLRAREYVGAARRALAAAPVAGSVYDTALGRHFITPSAAQRATIEDNYRQILGTLVVRNYICNSQNICGTEQAFWIPDDDLVHVCRPFWPLSPTCRAIILIHEGAHDVGFGIGGTHPPNRGSANYPAGNVAPPAGQTTALRMDNPDAYAFFAAHVWRSTDTSLTCF
ncbi:MAG TPA: hypothetical protein VLW45_06530 [Pelomicrobium sp.]|nr:hypothetical protein [Pelomicrobium sp.]